MSEWFKRDSEHTHAELVDAADRKLDFEADYILQGWCPTDSDSAQSHAVRSLAFTDSRMNEQNAASCTKHAQAHAWAVYRSLQFSLVYFSRRHVQLGLSANECTA